MEVVTEEREAGDFAVEEVAAFSQIFHRLELILYWPKNTRMTVKKGTFV